MTDYTPILYSLGVLNIVLYVMLIIGYIKSRKPSIPEVSNINEAFEILENSFRKSFSDLPNGFTWAEAISRAKALELKVNWKEVDNMVKKYEAYRYGDIDPGRVNPREILKLAVVLPRGVRKVVDRRS